MTSRNWCFDCAHEERVRVVLTQKLKLEQLLKMREKRWTCGCEVGAREREGKKSGGAENILDKIDSIVVEFILPHRRIENKLVDILVDTCFENDRYVN